MMQSDAGGARSEGIAVQHSFALAVELLDGSPHAVLLADCEWQILYANHRARELAQSAGELVGSSFLSAFPSFADSEARRLCLHAVQQQVPVKFERSVPAGVWFEIEVNPRRFGMALYCRDISRFKDAEQEMREREADLQARLQGGSVALHWVGPDGTILWANEAELTMLGYSRAEYIGRPISDFHVDAPVITDLLYRLSNNEKLDNYESRLRRKDGSIIDVVINSSVYRKDGKFSHTRCFTRDITAERVRVEARNLLSAIIESSDDAIVSKNLDGVITSWNKSAERVFGYTAEEAIGQPVATLIIPQDRQEEEPAILARLRRGERVDHFETKRRRKDGALLDVSLTISPVKDALGRIIGASKIARDITELVTSRDALRRANEELHRSNSDLEQFAYSASHDLKEPLRMVTIYGQLLRKRYAGKLDETADEYLGFIVEGGTRMDRLLSDLRDYTQVSLRKEAAETVVDANVVLEHALSNLKALIDESGAEIRSAVLPRVRLHEFQLGLLFQNLIGNAIRYRGEAAPRISIRADRQDDYWCFSVQDNGIGIDPEYREEIFGLFKRLHTASESSGSGMGLAICKRIVERAGGRIWVESEPGCGSTFYFLVPGTGEDRTSIYCGEAPHPAD